MNTRNFGLLLGAGGLLVILLVPVFGSPSAIDITFRACSLIALAVSWNLMASAGLISLGHSAFFGLGGYVVILSANLLGMPFWISLIASLAAGALFGSGLRTYHGTLAWDLLRYHDARGVRRTSGHCRDATRPHRGR